MLEWATYLKLGFLCNLANPITTMPSHLTQIPLIIRFKFLYPVPTLFKENLVLALQHCDRVYNISIKDWRSEDLGLHKALDDAFPMLETLSLAEVSADRFRVLPNNFVAPHLRALHLRNVTIPRGCASLMNAINLSSLRLEGIPDPGNFPPEYLVECIARMPYLDNISIEFPHSSLRLPDTAMESQTTLNTRIVLPRLSRLIFTSASAYLDSVLALISTPFLQDLRLTILLTGTPTVVRMSAFLGAIQNLNIRMAVMSFGPGSIVISYHPEQPSVAPLYVKVAISDCHNDGDRDHLRISMAQLCTDIAPAISVVESLALQSEYERPYGYTFVGQSALWNTILRPFVGVKVIRATSEFAAELSDALHPSHGAVSDLLPALSELAIASSLRGDQVDEAFAPFIHARRLAGHSIDLRSTQSSSCPSESHLRPPPISWSFDTF